MNFGKLLVTGKSWGVKPGGQYRIRKHVQLPKFNSPKNPFASGARSEPRMEKAAASVLPDAPKPVRLAEAPKKPGAATSVAWKNFAAPNLAGVAARAPRAVGAQAARAARWLGEWGQKLNPLPLLARRGGPARSAANTFKPSAVQAELSLDAVKVVRNDLSDADLEVVLVTKPMVSNQGEQLIMASAGGREPEGAINRLSNWMFGAKAS